MEIITQIKIGFLGCLLSLGCGLVQAETFLVEAGVPRAEIVIAEAPARMTKLAAQELQTYIEKISGATLPIVTEPTGKAARIYVGVSRHTEALGLKTEGLKHGAYRMASGTGWLALLGPDKDYERKEPWPANQDEWDALTPGEYYGYPYASRFADPIALDINLRDDGGTFNAVCDYLRELGVRWYFPGELGEIVQKRTDIPLLAVDRTASPDFGYRMPSYWYLHTQGNDDVILWTLRLGGFAGQELHGTTQLCHGLKYLTMRTETKEAHPDWYALWNGKRAVEHSYSGAPCLSSEGFFVRTLKFARWLFDSRDEPIYSLDLPDGAGRPCQCPLCAGKDTLERGWSGAMSDYVFDFVNRAATELYKTHPDRKVSALAYSSYTLPPQKIERLSPNLVLWLCQWRSSFSDPAIRARELDLRRDWLKVLSSGEGYIYEYYLHNCERYGYAGLPVYFPRLIAEDLRSLKGISNGELQEVYLHRSPAEFSWHPLAVTHLNLYVTLRLLWDVDQDVDAMLEEFYTLFYGPAAAPMKAFIEYSEKAWPTMRMDIASMDSALELLSTALAAAAPDSVYGQRVALVTAYLELLHERREKLLTYRQDAPVVRIGERSGEDLTIDGHLEESFWTNLTSYVLQEVETGKPAEVKTSFRAAWNTANRSLVIGIRCEEPDMKSLVANATQNGDPALFNEDAIELLIETPFHTFYQIVINSSGFVMDLDRKSGLDSVWSSEAELATFKGPDFWSLEIRIPTADHMGGGFDPLKLVNGAKPTAVEPWYVNVCRNRPREGQMELSAFSPTGKRRFGDPAKFARLLVE